MTVPATRSTPTGRPRLCVDVSNTLEATSLTGIQRITVELSQALQERVDLVLLDGRSGQFVPLRPDQRRRLQAIGQARGRSVVHRIESRTIRQLPPIGRPFTFGPDTALIDIEASWHAPVARADLLPRLDRSPTAALLCDVLPISRPDWFPPESVARFRSWFDAHVAAGSALLAISNASADEVEQLGIDRPSVIRLGVSDRAPVSDGAGILMVGTIEPRKGHAIVLDALDMLGEAAPIVDVVGRAGWADPELVDRLERHPKTRWHRGISDDDLATLWSLSGLLLQPSLGEGFGLPVTEALQRRVAVLSSDIAVLREAGRGETTTLPHDAAAWAEALATFAGDPRAWPRPPALDWPTWRDSAEDVVEALIATGAWPEATSGRK